MEILQRRFVKCDGAKVYQSLRHCSPRTSTKARITWREFDIAVLEPYCIDHTLTRCHGAMRLPADRLELGGERHIAHSTR